MYIITKKTGNFLWIAMMTALGVAHPAVVNAADHTAYECSLSGMTSGGLSSCATTAGPGIKTATTALSSDGACSGGNTSSCGARTDANSVAVLPIDTWDQCRWVDNTSATQSLFVPFKSAAEWSAFVNNAPSNIHRVHCALPASVNGDPTSTTVSPTDTSGHSYGACNSASLSTPTVYGRTGVSSITVTPIFVCHGNTTVNSSLVWNAGDSEPAPANVRISGQSGWSLTQNYSPNITLTAADGGVSGASINATAGDAIALTWTVSGASSCTASDGGLGTWNGGIAPTNGSTTVTALGTAIYTLTCTNAGGLTSMAAVQVTDTGACGSDNNNTSLTSTPVNLCSTYSTLVSSSFATEANLWTWRCNPIRGGNAASCSATAAAAQCGNANDTTLPAGNFCAVGTMTSTGNNGQTTTWTCRNITGNSTVSCQACDGGYVWVTNSCQPIVNGVCGAGSWTCNPGNASGGYSANNTEYWTCNGWYGGSSASCSKCESGYAWNGSSCAPIVNGVCGSDNGQTLAATPTNLCQTGASSTVALNGNSWSWTCAGSNTGSGASCSATHQLQTCTRNVMSYFSGTVPTGITGSISYRLIGGGGSDADSGGTAGAVVTGSFNANAGQNLTVIVGGGGGTFSYYESDEVSRRALVGFALQSGGGGGGAGYHGGGGGGVGRYNANSTSPITIWGGGGGGGSSALLLDGSVVTVANGGNGGSWGETYPVGCYDSSCDSWQGVYNGAGGTSGSGGSNGGSAGSLGAGGYAGYDYINCSGSAGGAGGNSGGGGAGGVGSCNYHNTYNRSVSIIDSYGYGGGGGGYGGNGGGEDCENASVCHGGANGTGSGTGYAGDENSDYGGYGGSAILVYQAPVCSM